MSDKIVIRPDRYRQFGAPEGAVFCFVTNSELIDRFALERTGGYAGYKVIPYDVEGTFHKLLAETIPEPAHVLVASPQVFFRSPDPDHLGSRRKLIAMACNSTPTSLEAIAHFLDVMERTDPDAQQDFAERFFEQGERTKHMQIIDDVHGTRAIFEHLNDDYEWNQQAGPIDWGEQQIAPMGELSVLPADIWIFNDRLSLAVNGEITLKGVPILHSGEPSFLREDQARIHAKLYGMRDHAIIATVENGIITALKGTSPGAAPIVDMLERMFDVDSRYRTIWELGFAINTTHTLLDGNVAMNEVHGATNGALHFGIGLTPYTQYHMDIICPGTRVLGAQGELLLGTPTSTEPAVSRGSANSAAPATLLGR
jgi:hypothetical protein